MSTGSNTPPDGYFNDLSQPTGNNGRNRAQTPQAELKGTGDAPSGGDSNAPKPKRIACIICRKRKLKCDGTKPSCSTCTRLGHDCAYDEVRRKSGPKRGYVKALEERLKQVETLLKTQDPVTVSPKVVQTPSFPSVQTVVTSGIGLSSIPANDFGGISGIGRVEGLNKEQWGFTGESPQPAMDPMFSTTDINMGISLDDNAFTWEMIGLGLEEPLPPQETIDELHQLYFDKIHPSLPMIHKYRYLAAMNLAPSQRPPVCLRYAMWTLAASVTEKLMDLKDNFYHRARKYVEIDYLKGHGENIISIAHAQTHCLLASYEFKMMSFPRAWMSTGSAVRMCQMMGLHRLDGEGLDVKQCLPPPRDWTEREERRRTFWMAFCEDRYASIGTGWPMTIDEEDILTDLPASDEAFEMSKPERTLSLSESMSPSGASKLSAFGGVVLMACLFGRNLIHLHRPDADDRDDDLNGEFWKRHRNMENILLNTSLSMPSHLKLPNGLSSPNIVFTNMNIHTSTICLHQAAIYKADKNNLPASISAESKVRCITAANEIASVMRMISHIDLSSMNPFISFCLYVAARVFVQYLKSKPEDTQSADSLRFLLSAMNAIKKKNPLTESFLVQLDVDLESLGMRNPKYESMFANSEDNLGISGHKATHTSKPPAASSRGPPNAGCGVLRNDCNFLRISEDVSPAAGDNNSPNAAPNQTDPMSATSGNAHNDNFEGDAQWLSGFSEHPQVDRRPEINRCLQGLVLQDVNDTFNESSNDVSTCRSPDNSTASYSASNRPTPNSSTPSDSRSNLHPGTSSAGTSYETSPASTHNQRIPTTDERALSSFFGTSVDYINVLPSTGLTPGAEYTMPEHSGRGFGDGGMDDVPQGWEMSGQHTSGLMPVGEGVFRQLMGLGPLDPMDIGWEGGS